MDTIPNWTELVPAYGREYKSQKAVKDAFLEGRDFRLRNTHVAATRQATSLADDVRAVGTMVILRYKRLTMTTTVKVTKKMLDEVGAKKAAWTK